MNVGMKAVGHRGPVGMTRNEFSSSLQDSTGTKCARVTCVTAREPCNECCFCMCTVRFLI